MALGLLEVQAVPVSVATINSVGLLEDSATAKLRPYFADIARGVSAELDQIGTAAASALSAAEFKAERNERLYPKYVRLNRAVNELLAAEVEPVELRSMVAGAVDSLVREVDSEWRKYFSGDAYREISFCVNTMRSSMALVRRLMSVKLDRGNEELVKQNEELRNNYNLAAQWSQFHLEALRAAIRNRLAMAPDVLEEILNGLRQSVMAYSYVRQGIDLRNVLNDRYAQLGEIEWDEEDQLLANAE